MKITFNLTTNLLLFLLSFCFNGISQSTNEYTVTLTVDLDELGDDPDAPGGCTFTVDPATALLVNDPANPKSFAIAVNDGATITWEGATTSGEEVQIKKISYLSGTEIFNRKTIYGKIKEGKEKVTGKALRKTPEGQDFEYLIRFKAPGNPKKFTIDPKIKVGGQG